MISVLTALLYLAAPVGSSLEEIIRTRPTTFVTDHAGVIDAQREHALNEKLAQFERDTTNQIIVYTLPKVPADTTVEELASKAIETWEVGQKGKDNGIILFVFPADRVMRVEVGYGLEPVLPDLKARRITNEVIKPHFQANDYAAGIEAGADALMAAATNEFGAAPRKVTPHPEPPGFIARAFSKGCGIAGSLLVAGIIVLALLLLLGTAALLFWAISRVQLSKPSAKSDQMRRDRNDDDDDDDSSSRSSRSSSSSSSSSRPSSSTSFKGGGGSGGGGGATDRW